MSKKMVVSLTSLSSFIFFFGYFITGGAIRNGFYNNRLLVIFPPLLVIGLIMIALTYNKKKADISNVKLDRTLLIIYLILLISILISGLIFGTIIPKLTSIFTIVIPSIIICYRIQNKIEFQKMFKYFLIFLKVVMLLIIIGDIIDILFDYSFSSFLADFTKIPSYYRQLKYNRCISIFGHPLFTAEIVLIYYIISNLSSEFGFKTKPILSFVISLFCIIMTKSRVGFLLILFSFLIFNYNNKNAKNLLFVLLLLFIGYELHLFDNIIDRFSSFLSSDVRNTSLNSVLNDGTLSLSFFKGQDLSRLGYSTLLSVALEYPILRWAYNFGIFNAIILSFLYFVVPLIYLVKRKQIKLLLCLFVIILDVNSYSSLGDPGTNVLLYCIFCSIILNISNYILFIEGEKEND